MQLDVFEESLLTEAFNMGVGRAAKSLSELGPEKSRVNLSVPEVNIVKVDELVSQIKEVSGDYICLVGEKYHGPFAGTAVVMYSHESSLQLVRIMLDSHFPLDKMTEMESDALCEVGNIILNACLATLANLFKLRIDRELPEVKIGGPREVLETYLDLKNQDEVLYLRMAFSIQKQDIVGHISFLLATEKIQVLLELLEQHHRRVMENG